MSKPDVDGKIDVIEELREALPEAHELTLQQERLTRDVHAAEVRIAALATELQPVARAIHSLRTALPVAALIPGNPIPIPLVDALAKAAEDAAKALGI